MKKLETFDFGMLGKEHTKFTPEELICEFSKRIREYTKYNNIKFFVIQDFNGEGDHGPAYGLTAVAMEE